MERKEGSKPTADPRRSARIDLAAQVSMRRAGSPTFTVTVRDLSLHGCRIEFVDRPRVHETVWVKFEGLESMAANVRWVGDLSIGVEFAVPLHAAVLDLLMSRIG